MGYNDISTINVLTEGRGVTRASFSVPMVIGRHNYTQPLYKLYDVATVGTDLQSDGFPVNSPIYRECVAVGRNSPKLKTLAVGRLLTDYTHVFKLTITDTAVYTGKVLSFTLTAPDGGADTIISYTVLVTDDKTTIATAIAALIDAVTDISAVGASEIITCTADNTNEQWYVNDLDTDEIEYLDETVDSNLVTDLNAINNKYSDWYGVILADPRSKARVLALGNSIETQEKQFFTATHDTVCQDLSDTTNVMYAANQLQLFRTYIAYSEHQGGGLWGTWVGRVYKKNPGQATWANWTLSGVLPDYPSAGAKAAFRQNKGNWYTLIGGLGFTLKGTAASGEFIDIVRGRDWFAMRLRERWATLANSVDKIAQNNSGIQQVVGQVVAPQFEEGRTNGFIDKEVPYVIEYPDISEIDDSDLLDRILNEIYAEGKVAGAFHDLVVTVSLGVTVS